MNLQIFLTLAIAQDIPLGRVDTSALSDQAMVELFFQNITEATKEDFYDKELCFRDICRLSGFQCNSEKRLTRVKHREALEGELEFRFLPRQLLHFEMSPEKATGTLDTEDLPVPLRSFIIEESHLRGEIKWQAMPPRLLVFVLMTSQFSGSCDLTVLPKDLLTLNVQSNDFSGSIVLDSLPEPLQYLNLSWNNFSGSLDLSRLPLKLRTLSLECNQFVGEFDLSVHPDTLEHVMANDNLLSGVAVVPLGMIDRVALFDNKIIDVVDEDQRPYPEYVFR